MCHELLSVWEVRHGAMMALREILTHQGSCARVYLPDLTSENFSLPDFCNKINSDAKRSREFDLNKQFGLLEENEPYQKRLRFSDEALVNGANVLTELPAVGLKIESDLGGGSDPKLPFSGVSTSAPVPDLVTNINKNSKLMKLVKLYQYSCLKNWEFLQDCAIRFVCVLSLDRYALLFISMLTEASLLLLFFFAFLQMQLRFNVTALETISLIKL
jgi:TATA-binding protein-associated factor